SSRFSIRCWRGGTRNTTRRRHSEIAGTSTVPARGHVSRIHLRHGRAREAPAFYLFKAATGLPCSGQRVFVAELSDVTPPGESHSLTFGRAPTIRACALKVPTSSSRP